MRFAASLQTRMSERPGSPVLFADTWCQMPQTALCGFSVTVKRTVTLTNGPRARSGSGSRGKKHSWGCEPTCTIAYCPQPFWLKGPLEPPFGRTFTPDCALQRACKPLIIHHSEYPIFESHSFLERVCCSTSSGQERLRGLSVMENGEDHHFRFTDLFNKTQYAIEKTTAHSHTLQRSSTLLANPHW